MIFYRTGTSKAIISETPENDANAEIRNPKIANMLPAYDMSQYPLFLISDSGLMMHEETLYEMALTMADDVGLVHQMPFIADKKGFSGSLEKVRRLLR